MGKQIIKWKKQVWNFSHWNFFFREILSKVRCEMKLKKPTRENYNMQECVRRRKSSSLCHDMDIEMDSLTRTRSYGFDVFLRFFCVFFSILYVDSNVLSVGWAFVSFVCETCFFLFRFTDFSFFTMFELKCFLLNHQKWNKKHSMWKLLWEFLIYFHLWAVIISVNTTTVETKHLSSFKLFKLHHADGSLQR